MLGLLCLSPPARCDSTTFFFLSNLRTLTSRYNKHSTCLLGVVDWKMFSCYQGCRRTTFDLSVLVGTRYHSFEVFLREEFLAVDEPRANILLGKGIGVKHPISGPSAYIYPAWRKWRNIAFSYANDPSSTPRPTPPDNRSIRLGSSLGRTFASSTPRINSGLYSPTVSFFVSREGTGEKKL